MGKRTRKGVAGYDVASLLVGSEGTLAVFTEVTVKLVPKPEAVITLLVTFAGVRDAVDAAQSLTASRLLPRCLELMDGETLGALRQAGNPIDARAGALLLVEVDGPSTEVEREAARVAECCHKCQALEVLVAQEPAARERLWAARREMSHAVRRLSKHRFAQYVVVPRQRIGGCWNASAQSRIAPEYAF